MIYGYYWLYIRKIVVQKRRCENGTLEDHGVHGAAELRFNPFSMDDVSNEAIVEIFSDTLHTAMSREWPRAELMILSKPKVRS